MDLQPLNHQGDVTPDQFDELFKLRMSRELYDRALRIFAALTALTPMFSFKVANVLHLYLQTGNVGRIIEQLERWVELLPRIPSPELAAVETMHLFDAVYSELALTPGVTLAGFGPFEVKGRRGGLVEIGVKQGGNKLWTPS